ncbi:MAG: hypothetical protein KIT33_06020 [Candidatus Kapabacteria bacterium]|nr:hypothetical protein [Ignavibacteriota bacterium]MCW5884512.1 hypothetical protein [Candidatus Kapabacteria bacterium]
MLLKTFQSKGFTRIESQNIWSLGFTITRKSYLNALQERKEFVAKEKLASWLL